MINPINTPEEAVKVIMPKLGWKFYQQPVSSWPPEPDMTTRWWKDGEMPMSPEQALVYSVDLNKLAEIWVKYPDWEIHKTKSLLLLDFYPEDIDYKPAMIDLEDSGKQILTFEVACLIATARAIQGFGYKEVSNGNR